MFKSWWNILRQTVSEWLEDNAPRLGAALAFYSILSLAPLLIIVLAIAGLFWNDDQAAQRHVVDQMGALVGPEGAKAIEQMIENAARPAAGIVASVLGVVTLLFGASGVFGQLQDALNTIWEVKPKPGRGIWGVIRSRFFSFAMVLGTGFLLMVSLMISAMLAAFAEYLSDVMPGLAAAGIVVNIVVSLGVFTVLFALIFKFVPDVKIGWRDVWPGAAATALLFMLGKFALGMYLGRGAVGSAYGAAGSLVVLVIWIYYSAQILFFGAELTQVYAKQHGSGIEPAENAERVTEESRAQQGMTRRDSGERTTGPAVGSGQSSPRPA